jgi:hypothetical protein
MNVQVSALRHSVEKGAQRRVVVAQGISSAGDGCIESRATMKGDGGDHRRQQNDRKDDPASQERPAARDMRCESPERAAELKLDAKHPHDEGSPAWFHFRHRAAGLALVRRTSYGSSPACPAFADVRWRALQNPTPVRRHWDGVRTLPKRQITSFWP